MYAINCSWVGQTFALAKNNDSEGRRSRIRRSKEERKTMVESFIKSYQISSSGNFPSLNLTHKEVGGSFYTVREIVREIIQENLVLGPAKLSTENQNTDWFSEQFQLGFNELEPQMQLSEATIETESVSNHLNKSEDLILTSNVQYTGSTSQILMNGQIVKGHEEEERNNDAGDLINDDLLTFKNVEEKDEEKVQASANLNQIWHDVAVETFPLRPVPVPDEVESSNGALEEKVEHSIVGSAMNQSSLENCSDLVYEKAVVNVGGHSFLEMESGLKNEIVAVNPKDESPDLSSIKTGHDIEDGTNSNTVDGDAVSALEILEPEQTIPGFKSDIASNGTPADINGTKASPTEGMISKEATVKEPKVTVQHNNGSYKTSKPALDRINIKSWEGASKNPKANPVFAIFKSFVAAFVKFWSE